MCKQCWNIATRSVLAVDHWEFCMQFIHVIKHLIASYEHCSMACTLNVLMASQIHTHLVVLGKKHCTRICLNSAIELISFRYWQGLMQIETNRSSNKYEFNKFTNHLNGIHDSKSFNTIGGEEEGIPNDEYCVYCWFHGKHSVLYG